MTSPTERQVLDNPSALVAQSQIRPVFRQAPVFVGIVTLVALFAPALTRDPGVILLIYMLWLAVVGGAMAYTYSLAQSQRQEAREVQLIEDLLQLKQDVPVSLQLDRLLSSPMRAPEMRARALLLTAVYLGRQYRYEESIEVCNALLDENILAVSSQITVKLTRVMAMLHADHLYDSDRAINELRKLIDRADPYRADLNRPDPSPVASAAGETVRPDHSPGPTAPAMLRWIEIFRDIKTGHHTEAIEIFERSREILRAALGHRAGEVYALVACACDALGQTDRAAQLFRDATALWPLTELTARYADVRRIAERYSPTYAPSFAPTTSGAPITPTVSAAHGSSTGGLS